MASISATTLTSTIARATLIPKAAPSPASSQILGLPQIGVRSGKVRCSSVDEKASGHGMAAGGASLLAAAATMASPALALVDERLSTEGTGLPFGLSNNLLGWILLGVFALIWSLFFVYASTLEEDEESGLSL